MSLINFPILYIPNPTVGRPLFSGKIFVGEPDTDPEVVINQKQLNIVQEDGTIVAVTQPFVLSAGGVPMYNGSTVRLDVDGNYSLKILDRLDAQAYYIDNVYEGEPVTVESQINDLSQTYDFLTVAEYKASTITFPINKRIYLTDRDASFTIIAGTGTGNLNTIIASDIVSQSASISVKDTVKITQAGAVGDGVIDNLASITDAIALGLTVDIGESGVFGSSGELPLNSNQKMIGSGATLLALSGLESGYTHKGLIRVDGKSNVEIDGVITTITATDFPDSGALKPQISAVLGVGSDNVKIKNCDFTGGANQFTADPSYQFIGIVDLRTCTDSEVNGTKIDGQYTIIAPASAPQTEGLYIKDCEDVKVNGNKVINHFSSGIVLASALNKNITVEANQVKNTKGSNLNMAGERLLVDGNQLETSVDQGNISVSEAGEACIQSVISNNIISDSWRAGIATAVDTVDLLITGNQIRDNAKEGTDTEANASVRLDGRLISVNSNVISTTAAPAIMGSSTNLSTPECHRIIINGNLIFGNRIDFTAPNVTISNNQIYSYAGNAIQLGFRCAGATVLGNRSVACTRTVSYSPDTGTPADYEDVQIHSNTGYQNTGDEDTSSAVETVGINGGRMRNIFTDPRTVLVLDDVLHATNIITKDASNNNNPALSLQYEAVCDNAFGTAFRHDWSVGYQTGGGIQLNQSVSFILNGIQTKGVGANAGAWKTNSADGTLWNVTVSNAGAIVVTAA